MATWVLIGAMEANGSTMRPRWHAASGRDGGQVCTSISARGAKTPCQKLSSRARTRCLSAPKALNESSHNRCGSVFGLKSSGRKERVPGTHVGTWNVSLSPGTRSRRSDVPDFYDFVGSTCTFRWLRGHILGVLYVPQPRALRRITRCRPSGVVAYGLGRHHRCSCVQRGEEIWAGMLQMFDQLACAVVLSSETESYTAETGVN